jgi:hypothetical protein
MFLFGLSVFFLLAWTFFESAFMGLSTFAERIAAFSLLVLPAGIGALIGVLSLTHKEGKSTLAITGILSNTIFAVFHLLIVLLAG